MKKAITNYSKCIWFKVINDKMSRNEALILFAILFGLSLIAIDALTF